MRIYVGNLSYGISEEELEKEFAAFGQVTSVTIPQDGRSKGFGFVEMPSKSEAEAAIAALNGKTLQWRPLTVNERVHGPKVVQEAREERECTKESAVFKGRRRCWTSAARFFVDSWPWHAGRNARMVCVAGRVQRPLT